MSVYMLCICLKCSLQICVGGGLFLFVTVCLGGCLIFFFIFIFSCCSGLRNSLYIEEIVWCVAAASIAIPARRGWYDLV